MVAAHPRPLLATLLLAGCAIVGKQLLSSCAFAAPPASHHSRGPTSAHGPGFGTAPAATAVPVSRTTVPVCSVAAFAAALTAARTLQRAAAQQQAQAPPQTHRSERAAQTLPLGKRFQRFFSARNRQFWDYVVHPRTYFNRAWTRKDLGYGIFFAVMHLGAFAAPFYFTWPAFACFLIGYVITGMFGITLSYHRQLAHRSFKTPKLLEYVFAYCGALALQSHPINWVSSHRHHHGGTETEKDVHSPLDGFWWAHMGWLMDVEGTWMRRNKGNVTDLTSQWFYRFLAKTYPLHAIALPIALLYYFGGLPFVFWGFFARVVWVWHVTWAVNSVSHVWGFKDWNTQDNSMNNWFVASVAFGEGWHNNHHAFESSCRHGLKRWQIDPTWYTVKLLSFLGLATDLKYPSEGKMRKLSFPAAATAAA